MKSITLENEYSLIAIGNSKGFIIKHWEIKKYRLKEIKKFRIILLPIEK